MGLFKKQKTDTNKNIFEGSSIQQAVMNAAAALNVPTDQINYDVISYGSTGVFGLVGNKRAKIRVRPIARVKEKALSATEKYWREIQEEQKSFASKELVKEKTPNANIAAKTGEEAKAETLKQARPNKPKRKPNKPNGELKAENRQNRKTEKPKTTREFTAEEAKNETFQSDASQEKKHRQRSRRRRNNGPEKIAADIAIMPDEPSLPLEGPAQTAYDVLNAWAQALLDAPFNIEHHITDKKATFVVKGDNLSAMIGKNGNTRRSMQLVMDRIINKGGQSKYDVTLVVDTNRQQNKSKRALTILAKKKADICRKTREEISLGEMNAYERCVIHIALKKDPDVETKSVGEGAKKELLIIPSSNKNKSFAEPEPADMPDEANAEFQEFEADDLTDESED